MNESRLEELLEKFHDGTLTEDESRNLIDWFDEDEARVSTFIDDLRIGNALAALHVMDSDSIPHVVKDSLKRSNLAIDISRSVRQEIEHLAPPVRTEVGRSNRSLRKSAPWWVAAVAVAALIAWFAFLPTQPDSGGKTIVAMVQNARNVQEISAGDPLRAGQVLKLADGRVKINFHSGAKLVLEAPAKLRLLGPNSAQLERGVVTVRVPGKLKGFVLDTPRQRVTDLGTSFGVSVDTTGDTSISVFEGEIELEDHRRLVSGQAVALTSEDESAREVPYAINQFLNTWQVSFGVEQLTGDVRVATPNERQSPGKVADSDSLLLFPEREDVVLKRHCVVSGTETGTYRRPLRKHTVKLTEDVRVDSFLLQYNPVRDGSGSGEQVFRGELYFDRPIVALILQKDLLDDSDTLLALPSVDFDNIFRRGINVSDVVTLSPDRRVLHVAFVVKNGVDQIRVLVASDNNEQQYDSSLTETAIRGG